MQKINIIAGKYKNRKLDMPNIKTTRPTKSIVRGSVFDSLQFDIDGVIFVEAFGGSGSMGLEALSRGASFSYFIERDRECFTLLQKNIEKIDTSRSKAIFGDTFKLIDVVIDELRDDHRETIFYLDPPFSIRDGESDVYDRSIELIKKLNLPNTKKVIVEHMSKVELDRSIGVFNMSRNRKFGSTTISFFEV